MPQNDKFGEIPPSGLQKIVWTNFPDARTHGQLKNILHLAPNNIIGIKNTQNNCNKNPQYHDKINFLTNKAITSVENL